MSFSGRSPCATVVYRPNITLALTERTQRLVSRKNVGTQIAANVNSKYSFHDIVPLTLGRISSLASDQSVISSTLGSSLPTVFTDPAGLSPPSADLLLDDLVASKDKEEVGQIRRELDECTADFLDLSVQMRVGRGCIPRKSWHG